MILAHDVERVLADVDTDHRGDRYIELAGHGVLLVLAPLASFSRWWGPEHGRTIPLAGAARRAACSAGTPRCLSPHGLHYARALRPRYFRHLHSNPFKESPFVDKGG